MTVAVQILVAVALGALLSAAFWHAGRPVFDADVFARSNYRDQRLPTAVGVLIALVLLVVVGVNAAVAVAVQSQSVYTSGWTAVTEVGPVVVLACVGFAFLGLIDDVAGINQSGGFTGHLRALAHGKLTTGMIKLIGGAMISAIVVSRLLNEPSVPGFIRDVGVLSLTANLANLLDRAPGRTIKAVTLAFAAVVGVTLSELLVAPAIAIGAGFGLLPSDLREDMMLGDAGSNTLGAALGVSVVLSMSTGGRWVALGVLIALNALSEIRSFTAMIDRTPLLRWLDRLGAPHRDR